MAGTADHVGDNLRDLGGLSFSGPVDDEDRGHELCLSLLLLWVDGSRARAAGQAPNDNMRTPQRIGEGTKVTKTRLWRPLLLLAHEGQRSPSVTGREGCG